MKSTSGVGQGYSIKASVVINSINKAGELCDYDGNINIFPMGRPSLETSTVTSKDDFPQYPPRLLLGSTSGTNSSSYASSYKDDETGKGRKDSNLLCPRVDRQGKKRRMQQWYEDSWAYASCREDEDENELVSWDMIAAPVDHDAVRHKLTAESAFLAMHRVQQEGKLDTLRIATLTRVWRECNVHCQADTTYGLLDAVSGLVGNDALAINSAIPPDPNLKPAVDLKYYLEPYGELGVDDDDAMFDPSEIPIFLKGVSGWYI